MVKELRPAIVMLLLFTLITGVIYPLVITGNSTSGFPEASERQSYHPGGKTLGLGINRSTVRPD